MTWGVDLVDPCSIDVFQADEDTGKFHAFILWNGTKECAHATAETPARAISQAYANRCTMWLGTPGEELRPANLIEPDELIPAGRWTNLCLAIPFCLFLLLAFLMWRYL